MSKLTSGEELFGLSTIEVVRARQIKAVQRRSPARGIMIGLGLSVILWIVLALAAMMVFSK